eukprot:436359-Pyramimonas_sp.AAC.1
MGKQPVNVRDGVSCTSKPYLSALSQKIIDDLMETYAPTVLSDKEAPMQPIIELWAKHGKMFKQIMPMLMKELKDLDGHCQRYDG